MTTNEHKALVRDAARRLIDAVVPRLEAERVLPVSRYHPYIRVGTDYFGDDVRAVPEHDAFEYALTHAYPDRFGDKRPLGEREFPATFLYSFLEAAVTECARRDQVIDGSSPGTKVCIDELLASLETPTVSGSTCRFVTHLTTDTGRELSCCGIDVIPLDGSREAERIIMTLLPRALARLRDFPFVYSPPHALLVATGTGTIQEDLGVDLSRRIDRFLLALRLLRAVSTASIYEFRGSTTSVGRHDPTLFTTPAGFVGRFRRAARVSSEDNGRLEAIAVLAETTQRSSSTMAIEPLAMAFHKYNRSYEAGRWYEHLADLTTALEATLSGTEKMDVVLRIRSRAAALLATEDDPAQRIFDDLGSLYDLRSTVVHGAALTTKDLHKKIDKLNGEPPGSAFFGGKLDLAVDRLRDLVRRAIVARMCLAEGQAPLWPLTRPPSVDSILSDDILRRKWRESWQRRLGELDAEEAGRTASKSFSWLSPHDEDFQ